MAYVDFLKQTSLREKSIICLGADPDPEKMPIKDTFSFYKAILDAIRSSGEGLGAVKPNYAFFAQIGFPGLDALYNLIKYVKEIGYPVILDAKRGDIGNTSRAYAHEAFEFWGADAVTVAPYMGTDSIMPFVEIALEKGRGIYVLTRTSNPGAQDLQAMTLEDGRKVFMQVAGKVVDWNRSGNGNVGAVVGATSPDELEQVVGYFQNSGQLVPLLIPGVGRQGGEAWQVTEKLIRTGAPLSTHRINVSRDLNYAYEKLNMPAEKFAEAALIALKNLNQQVFDTAAKYAKDLT